VSSGEIGESTQSVKWQIPYAYHRFWPRMRAFAVPTFYDGRVRINLQGRERDGVVPLEEYEQACREVVNAARACRNPRTGRELVADVTLLRAEDPMDPDGPEADVQLVWDGVADSLEHPDVGTIGPFPYRRTGGHRRDGFLFLAGPGIERHDLGERDALDVTPTILALLGRKPTADVEGTTVLRPESIDGAHRG